ncbi:MAG TPA: PAS domain-containing sensor histidine kinase [Polyangiaceae bacterium]
MAAGEKLSEECCALLNAAPCGLLQTTADGTILRVNRTFCGWIGYPEEELLGQRRLQDLFTMGGRIFHQTHWAPLIQMQGSISEVKFDVRHRDGTTVPMVFNAALHVQNGAVVHEVAAYVARDRDTYERELVLSRKRLEELHAEANDRALFAEQMIGIVSHDLRNPLASVLLGTALLGGGELSESQQRTLNRITSSTERANRLIADLLDFTQARLGGGLSVSLESIDLHEAVAQAVDELAHVHPGRQLRHLPRGQGQCAADANRLAQLIGNLVSNAMVYGKPGTPVTVTSCVESARFSLAVHNEGSAIPEALKAHIFEPMTRGTGEGTVKRSVGLGLYIVREIAKAHGGTATLVSTDETGTTFTVEFPRADAEFT